MAPSLAERVAALPTEMRDAVLADMDLARLEYDVDFWLRPEQLEVLEACEWLITYLAGRGAGKTRTGAEWIRKQAQVPLTRIALVARTAADVRDTMIMGESGILAVHPPSEMPEYVPSLRRLTWPNGSVATTFSAEKPAQLRGPQFHKAWADELAAWKMKPDDSGLNAWDNLQIATRLGVRPQIFSSTTPKRVKAVRKIVDDAKVHPGRIKLVRGSTLDNAANLAAVYLETIMGMYAGTSIERQELYGELLDSVDGALWNEALIKRTYDLTALATDTITVVGVDPSVAEKPGDECGIVVVKSTRERKLYQRDAWVVDDRSLLGSPDEWAKRVVETAKDWKAVVVAEQNQGGALVKLAIKGVDPSVPVVLVSATKGKSIRAEPVVMAYEQERVEHVGSFPQLEDEMTGWVPGESGYSPNRLDALVWALTSVLVDDSKIRHLTGEVRLGRKVVEAQVPNAVPAHRRGRPAGRAGAIATRR